MYEFAAAEGVKIHPNGVSLAMPESTSRDRVPKNGAAASSADIPGEAWPVYKVIS